MFFHSFRVLPNVIAIAASKKLAEEKYLVYVKQLQRKMSKAFMANMH